jgi:hypothetical protein
MTKCVCNFCGTDRGDVRSLHAVNMRVDSKSGFTKTSVLMVTIAVADDKDGHLCKDCAGEAAAKAVERFKR